MILVEETLAVSLREIILDITNTVSVFFSEYDEYGKNTIIS